MPLTTTRSRRAQGSWLAGYVTERFSGSHGGFNSLQSPDNIHQGLGKRGTIQSPDCLNVYSYPFGAITSIPGNARINGANQITIASVVKNVQGLAYLGELSATLVILAGSKFWKDVAGVPTDITGTLTLTDNQDNLMDADIANGVAVFTDRSADGPWQWAGTGNATILGGSPRAGVKYVVAFDRRTWLFSAQNSDFSNDQDNQTYDQTFQTLNFWTNDGAVITSATVVGNSIYVGKEGPNASEGHLFRIYRTGNPALPYDFERIETGGVGPISQQATKAIGQDLVFLGKDGNVYLVRGNVLVPGGIGRNIQRELLTNYSKNRFQFAVMGLWREKGYLGLSLSLSGSGTHNRTWWYDYINSVPGNPELEIWFPGSQAVNAMAERVVSGQRQLILGDYSGYYSQHDSGNSFGGAAYNKYRITPWHLLGDLTQVYHVLGMVVVVQPLGTQLVTVQYRTDFNLNWSTAQTVSLSGGGATLGSFVLGTDVLGGKEQSSVYLTLSAIARRIQFRFQNTLAGQPFTIYSYNLILKPLYRGVNIS